MPILMVALIALAAFGLIGFLLAAAVVCESKTAKHAGAHQSSTGSASKPAA
jgi:hypothetical protein